MHRPLWQVRTDGNEAVIVAGIENRQSSIAHLADRRRTPSPAK
jgi:hypothetical protein